nr:hypothetical protein [Tanacetum cinerariifolium]
MSVHGKLTMDAPKTEPGCQAYRYLLIATAGTHHRTTSIPRLRNPDVDEGELSAQRNSTVIRLRIPPRRSNRLTPSTPVSTIAGVEDMTLQDTIQLNIAEQKSHDNFKARQNVKKVNEHLVDEKIEKMEEEESAEDDYELIRRVKGKHVEDSKNTPSLTSIRSPRTYSTLVSSDTKKLQELTVADSKSLSTTPSLSSPKPTLSMSQHIDWTIQMIQEFL